MDWKQCKKINWTKVAAYSFGSVIAIIGIGILVTVLMLVLMERFDDRYRNSHPEEFGQAAYLESTGSSLSKEFNKKTEGNGFVL